MFMLVYYRANENLSSQFLNLFSSSVNLESLKHMKPILVSHRVITLTYLLYQTPTLHILHYKFSDILGVMAGGIGT
jgi:hypothetical protein